MKTPASLFLGALAPMPPPTATGPPGMVARKSYTRVQTGVKGEKKGPLREERHEKR